MIQIRKSNDRGYADHGWLKSRHTFSFAEYQDPKFMRFRSLRVINEDRIAGGQGFDTHPHKDMEIVSYVVKGELRHKDSMGNATIIRPGEIQRMSAGTGIQHSEYNNLPDDETHFLQIWIFPERSGITPEYGQKSFERELRAGDLVLALSRNGRDGSVPINQDVDLYLAKMKTGAQKKIRLSQGRYVWIQLVAGSLKLNGELLEAGDGASVSDLNELVLLVEKDAEFLMIDMP